MKVICLVPSWTEMLIECGIEVVGRTQFCIHPKEKTDQIPAVGGTKDLDWQKVLALNADFLLLDQEENLLWMRENAPLPVITTHVTSVASVSGEIGKIAQALKSTKLNSVIRRWQQVEKAQAKWNWDSLPEVKSVLLKEFPDYENLIYVIWKQPWMRAGNGTFIASVFEKLGANQFWVASSQKYPHFELEDFDKAKTFFLFSSEPFPFAQKEQTRKLRELVLQSAIVDGESFSWFGVRALRFLEKKILEPQRIIY